MILSREELVTTLLIFTGVILLLACCVGLIACLSSQVRCKRQKNRHNKPNQATTSSSYNPLIQPSKSDPISLDIEYIDTDHIEQPVSPAVQVKSLHVSAAP